MLLWFGEIYMNGSLSVINRQGLKDQETVINLALHNFACLFYRYVDAFVGCFVDVVKGDANANQAVIVAVTV